MNEFGFWWVAAALVATGFYAGLTQAGEPSLSVVIAAQGNAAVRAIRADAREAVRRQAKLEFPLVVVQQVARSG